MGTEKEQPGAPRPLNLMTLHTVEDEPVAVNIDHISWLRGLAGGVTRVTFSNGGSLDIATPIVDLARALAGLGKAEIAANETD